MPEGNITERPAGKPVPAKVPAAWRALYVNSRCEKRVFETLTGKGLHAYVPLVKTVRQWSDRKKVVEMPLLNGYVFVKVEETQQEKVLQARGVVSFVRSEGRIATIREAEIARLKQLVELGYHLEASADTGEITAGQKVKVRAGALKGLEGIVSGQRDQRQFIVQIESLGLSIKAWLPKDVLLPV